MRILRPLILPAMCCCLLHADVTEKRSFRIEPGKQFPPEVVDAMSKSMGSLLDSLSFETKIKGNRAAVRNGTSLTLSDFDAATVTLIDPNANRFSTVSAQEFQRAWREWRDEALPKAASKPRSGGGLSMQISEPVRATGRTRKVQGIEVEEQAFEFSAGASEAKAPPIRMVVSIWSPTQSEKVRNPALLEMQRYNDRAFIESAFGEEVLKALDAALPMSGLKDLAGIIMKNAPLEVSISYFMAFPGMDASQSLMRMALELTELSTTEIPDSAFAIPRDYIPAGIEELLRAPASEKPRKVQAPVMLPGAGDDDPVPQRPKRQRREP